MLLPPLFCPHIRIYVEYACVYSKAGCFSSEKEEYAIIIEGQNYIKILEEVAWKKNSIEKKV
jgi:hypothetical protein